MTDGCSPPAAIWLVNKAALLHGAAGKEALTDCIRVVKNRHAVGWGAVGVM